MRRLLFPTWLPDSRVVRGLAAELRICRAHALGSFVMLCLNCAQDHPSGHVADFSDQQIEEWAGWKGRRGRFAAAFRRVGLTPSGRIRGWWSFTSGVHSESRPPIPLWLRLFVFARDGGRCRNCHTTADLELDHVVPWARGGRHTADNLQLLCGPCNRVKGAK